MNSNIRQAFSKARKPLADEITSCPCDECRELAIFFSQFNPETTSIDDLRQHETFLVHGTTIAFRYFLPYFLELSMQDLNKAGAIPDLIVDVISNDFKHLDRVYNFSIPEVECLQRYFDLLVERGEHDEEELCGARKTLSKLVERKR